MDWAKTGPARAERASPRTIRFMLVPPPCRFSAGEEIAVGFPLASHEQVQDLVLEGEEILEQSLQLVGAIAAPRLAKVLELVLQQPFARAPVEDEEHDVEQKSTL